MKATGSTDKALVRRLLAGEERAFDELFEIQVPRLYRIALARLDHDPDLAEEMVQRTLTRAVPKLASFRGEASLLTWLTTFCYREISAYFRKEKRGLRAVPLSEESPEVTAALEALETAEGPEHDALRADVKRLVQATLDRLPPRYAQALEWKYLEDVSVKEIAERLKVGPIAAQSLLARARDAFREAFVGVGGVAGIGEMGRV